MIATWTATATTINSAIEGNFSKAGKTARTIVNTAATAATISNPEMGTTCVPTETATSMDSGTLPSISRTIEGGTVTTSSRVCGTASTIVSMAATAATTGNPETGTTAAPTKTATNMASGTLRTTIEGMT